MVLSARRFIVGSTPELKFRTNDEADTAHVVNGLPPARKPWYSARHSAYFASMPSAYAADVFITLCLSPCSCRVLVRQKQCDTYQCCYKFWLWIFLFRNLFFQIFFPTFFNFFFLESFTFDASPLTDTTRTLCICVMKNMIYSKRSKLDFCLVRCVRYSLARHEKFNFFLYRIIFYYIFIGICDI